MAIGINWAEVWKPVWKPVWRTASVDVSIDGVILTAAANFAISGAVTTTENINITGDTIIALAIIIGGGATTPIPGASTRKKHSLEIGLGIGI